MAGYDQPGDKPPEQQDEQDKPVDGEETLTAWLSDVDSPNLVPLFLGEGEEPNDAGKKWLGDTLAAQVCGDVKQGLDDSEDYRNKRKTVNRLYTGFLKKKTFPHPDACNAHIPLLLERVQRVAANVYAEILQERDLIFGVKATGPDDYETAEILTVYGNWRLRNELTDFMGQMDRAVVEFFLAGSVFCYSWRDAKNNRNRHDILSVDEIVVPYVFRTDQVDLSDVPWKARIVRKYRHELEDLRDSGEWAQVDAVIQGKKPSPDSHEDKTREQGEKSEGIHKGDKTSLPWLFYDYHGWIRMPGEKRQRPIRAVVSAEEKIVVLLQIREEPDWRDQQRFDRETAEQEQYLGDMEAYQQATAPVIDPMTGVEMPPPPQMDPETGMLLPPPEPPPTPAWAEPDEMGAFQPKPVRRVPIEMFAHGRCSYNPDGMLGLGFGDILAPFNKMNDEALNRFFDQATANNSPMLLTAGEQLPGNTALVPGKVVPLKNANGDSLDKVIKEYRPGPANPQLMDIIRYGDEASDSAVAAPGVLSGQPGKSGETFRGLATRAEKATKQLTTSGVKLLAFLDQILKNDAKLQANFAPENEIAQVNNHLADYRKFTTNPDGSPKEQLNISRDMYRRNFDVTFTADVRFTSQAQKIAEADEVLAMVNSVYPPPPPPPPGMPPMSDPAAALRHAAVVDVLRARSKQDLIPLLGPMPPVPGSEEEAAQQAEQAMAMQQQAPPMEQPPGSQPEMEMPPS